MARVLTKLRVTEVSSVDKGAGDGVRVVLMKRHDDAPRGRYRKFFEGIDFTKLRTRKIARDEVETAATTEDTELPEQFRQFIAALQLANPKLTDEEAAFYLLHNASGRALAEHLASVTKKEEAMDRMDTLRSFVKRDGIIGIAKHIVANGTGVTEAEFSDLIAEAAKRERRAGESDASAFARLFEDPANVDLRKAYAITKNTLISIEPTQVGGGDVNADGEKALAQLRRMAEEMRSRSPTLSADQAFSRVFEDPANSALAAKAHRRPTPTTSYEFPR